MSILFQFLTIRIPIKDENNLILSTKTEIIKKKWQQYYEKLIASNNTNTMNRKKSMEQI